MQCRVGRAGPEVRGKVRPDPLLTVNLQVFSDKSHHHKEPRVEDKLLN